MGLGEHARQGQSVNLPTGAPRRRRRRRSCSRPPRGLVELVERV